MNEEITREPVAMGHDGQVQYETVLTGRPRRPESAEEWRAQRIAGLQGRHYPAAQAVLTLLAAGAGFDVKATGKSLDEYQRHAVLLALTDLLEASRTGYPPAAALMRQLLGAWVRAWGDRAPLPRRTRPVAAPRRPRPSSLADTGADAAGLRASWDRFGAAVLARRAPAAGRVA